MVSDMESSEKTEKVDTTERNEAMEAEATEKAQTSEAGEKALEGEILTTTQPSEMETPAETEKDPADFIPPSHEENIDPKAGEKTEGKGEELPAENVEEKSVETPEDKPEEKLEEKPEEKPEERMFEKPEERSEEIKEEKKDEKQEKIEKNATEGALNMENLEPMETDQPAFEVFFRSLCLFLYFFIYF